VAVVRPYLLALLVLGAAGVVAQGQSSGTGARTDGSRPVASALMNAGPEDSALESSAKVAAEIEKLQLDPKLCFRVRDLSFNREDLKVYLTDGYLLFGKRIRGRLISAVYTTDVEGGDGEVLLMPPSRSERLSLASFTNSPNLNEHIRAAVFVFTDKTGEELLEAAQSSGKLVPEIASTLAESWEPIVRNLSLSFGVRLVQDLFIDTSGEEGFFFAAISGRTLGNFDVLFEPRAREQIVAGQVVNKEDRVFFNIWTSFRARSWRSGRKQIAASPVRTEEFRIQASMEPNLHLRATTSVRVKALKSPGRAIAFDLSRRMKLLSAKIDGQPAEIFSRDSFRANLLRSGANELFLVIRPTPFEPGKTYELEFEHEGDVVSQAGNGVYFVGARGDWYPNRGTDFSRYDITFRYPKELTLVTTGDIIDSRVDGEFQVTHRRTPSPVRFAGFNLGSYEKAVETRGPIQVEVFANKSVESALLPRRNEIMMPPPPVTPGLRRRVPNDLAITIPPTPPDPKARLRELASDFAGVFEFLHGMLGPPPITRVTVSPIPGAFGQGFPGLIYLSTLAYLNPDQRPTGYRDANQQLFYSELLHAHESAHQWWGNLVSAASPQDEWLMESLANYSALLYLEKKKGRKALDGVLAHYRDRLLVKTPEGRALESAGPIIWGGRLNSSQTPDAWRIITYEKGSWIVHMLRARLGDERFLSMLREIIKRHSYSSLTTEQFQQIAREFLPTTDPDKKLDAFFDHWVYGTGVPALKLSYTSTGKAPNATAKANLEQSSVDTSSVIHVPVVVSAGGTRQTRWVETAEGPVPFSVPLKGPGAKLSIDDTRILMQP
jgi:hypothetical protein